MATITLSERNIYARGYIVEFLEGDSLLKRRPLVYSSTSLGDKTHLVKQGDTLYALSSKYYNSDQLWHVIADVNDISNPFSLTPGTELLIPEISKVRVSYK